MNQIIMGSTQTYRVTVQQAGKIPVTTGACCVTDVRILRLSDRRSTPGASVKVSNGEHAVTKTISLDELPGNTVIRTGTLRFADTEGELVVEAQGERPSCVVLIDIFKPEREEA